VATVYLSVVATRAALDVPRSGAGAVAFAAALPVMHLAWAVGFLDGLLRHPTSPATAPATARG
jgi:hypothetical protein